jgi:hypothetical protein
MPAFGPFADDWDCAATARFCLGLFDTCPRDTTVRRMAQT